MDISEKILEALNADKQNFNSNIDFNSLRNFYVEMIKLGIAQKQQYNLPPLDTIGRRFYQSISSKMPGSF